MRPSRRGSSARPAIRATGRSPLTHRRRTPTVPGQGPTRTPPNGWRPWVADVAEVPTSGSMTRCAGPDVEQVRQPGPRRVAGRPRRRRADAQQQVDVSKKAVSDANAAIIEAQKRFDTFCGRHLRQRSVVLAGDAPAPRGHHLHCHGRSDPAMSNEAVMAGWRTQTERRSTRIWLLGRSN